MQIDTQRSYDIVDKPKTHPRYLVDRLWPRGLTKDSLQLDGWPKQLSPSDDLRKWYHHSPEDWATFQVRYFKELDSQPEAVAAFLEMVKGFKRITLVYSAKEEKHNNAIALMEYLVRRI